MNRPIYGNPATTPNPVADFNQNNPNKADYIKNRPFYEVAHELGSVDGINETQIPVPVSVGDDLYVTFATVSGLFFDARIKLQEGVTEYRCCVDCVKLVFSGMWLTVYNVSEEHDLQYTGTITVSQITVKTLAERFIPDSIPRKDDIPICNGDGKNSLKTEVSTAIAYNSTSLGYDTVTGIKGYYCYKVIPDTGYGRKLIVSDRQYTKNDNFYEETNIIDTTKIAEGDKISICNGIRVYFECSTVIRVSPSHIVVDTVPFEQFDDITTNDVEQSDRFIFIANKPDVGYSVIGNSAFSSGIGNKSINFGAFSCGITNNSIGAGAFTTGCGNIAEFLAAALGLKTVAGPYAHAQNMYVEATGIGSSGEGYKTKVPGTYAHGEGQETEASAPCAHSQNFKTKATAPAAHAQNNQTEASGENSDATGFKTKSKAKNSHTGGEENTTETTAVNGFTEGYKNTNRAPRSFIAGGQWNSTSADANDSLVHGIACNASAPAQRVGGKYPKGDPKYVEIVGNGKSSSARSNAYTLDWEGNACFSGSVECNGIIVKSPNGTRFKLTVSDDGTISTSKV